MATKDEPAKYKGEFLVSSAATQVMDTGTLILGQNLVAGSVLGRITASSKLTLVNPGAITGEQTAVAILFDNVDATAGDVSCLVVVAPAEVDDKELNWGALTSPQKVTARGQLDAVGIRVRL